MRRIRTAAETRKVPHIDGGNAVGQKLFAHRENVRRIVPKETGSLCSTLGPIKEVRSVHGNVDLVEAEGNQNFVYLRGANGPNVVDRVGLVGAMEKFWCFSAAAIERLIFIKIEINAPETEALALRQIDI